MLTSKQKYDVSVQLVSLLMVGYEADRAMEDGHERQLLRVFACNFACNNTPMIEGKEEAHALCSAFFESYYAMGDWSEEDIEQQNSAVSERFTKYYEATALIGTPSDRNVPIGQHSVMTGTIPFAAFVKLERAFSRFARGRDLSPEETANLISRPMNGHFGLFLTVWDEAERRIQAVLDPEEFQAEEKYLDTPRSIGGFLKRLFGAVGK